MLAEPGDWCATDSSIITMLKWTRLLGNAVPHVFIVPGVVSDHRSVVEDDGQHLQTQKKNYRNDLGNAINCRSYLYMQTNSKG